MPFSPVVPWFCRSPVALTKSWDNCFHWCHIFLVLLTMPRLVHVAMMALPVLAFTLTGCHGVLKGPLGDERHLVETFPLSEGPTLSIAPFSSPSIPVPSFSPSQPPSTIPSSTPSSSAAPSTPLPSFQPAVMGKFDWDLSRVGTAQITFNEDFDNGEIMLNYNISLRHVIIAVFEENCRTPVPSSVVTASDSITQTSSRHGTLTVNLDIMQDAVVGSGIWSDGDVGTGYVNVCVRIDLLLDDQGTSVHFHEQKLYVTIDLLQGFEVTVVDLSRVSADEQDGDAAVQYDLVACQCDDTFECMTSILKQGSDVHICVTTLADDVEVIDIQALSFSQGSFSVASVVNGVPDILSDVFVIDKKAVVRTQMLSVFFEHDNPIDIIAEGTALLGFTGDAGTRLLRSRTITRCLNGAVVERDTSFRLPLPVASSLEDAPSAAGSSLMSIMTIMVGVAVLQW